ncbi:hypothetical protein HMPREF9629_01438 [Peptoanaerobacter stomatis]|uniref:Uncharacterized protein n=1 Tax=Peptoanaerobacter stomatis TaxID=796937 RepID=G9WZ37_9FIRM|nr:hypothetical protein [Peptoanaerobacter stomatis]EHL16182.1 hypothetical protein HMPREF9629_01438 [Peptoanaerobacter stomatis]
MFNNNLKNEALKIHEDIVKKYNDSYSNMLENSEKLYVIRKKSIELINLVEMVINSIAHTPKEFDTNIGKIVKDISQFRETEEYVQEAYKKTVKVAENIGKNTAFALGIASMAPNAFMAMATTFGTASTGTAISALSGAAAQKAAIAWIGRTFAGFLVKEGAGMLVGNMFLGLIGPIGWGIGVIGISRSIFSLSEDNKKIADEAVKEAKEILKLKESLDETNETIRDFITKTNDLYNNLSSQKNMILSFMNLDYNIIDDNEKLFLGTLVNNTLSLSALLNKNIGN